MSSLYNLEPQPTAKVVLQTTSGDLALELFAKQTPLASRNFLQHCLDGYYNGTIFHRLVPGFIVQGGDPTGTGAGGESAINNGEPFANEFHSRLKFNRRGLLGMANEGGDESNTSQFFLTLGATTELQSRNTMFGRIEGDTIYNLMKIADAEMTEGEGSERPLYPTKITSAEILVNPFDDMVARVKEAPRTKDEAGVSGMVKKRKKPVGKNVLSFGMDEGEEEVLAPVAKKTKANPKLVSVAVEGDEKRADDSATATRVHSASVSKKSRQQRMASTPSDAAEDETHLPAKAVPPRPPQDQPSPQSSPEPEPHNKAKSTLEKTNAEIAALKASMKRNVETTVKEKENPKNALEAMIPATSTRGRKRGKATDEKGAMDLFKSFKQRLDGLPGELPAQTGEKANGHNYNSASAETLAETDAVDEEAELCDLHFIANCQSCKSWDTEKPDGEAEADGDDGGDWMAHTLSFAKDTLGKDLEWKKKMEEIEVIDPREKAKNIKDEKRKGREKAKSTK